MGGGEPRKKIVCDLQLKSHSLKPNLFTCSGDKYETVMVDSGYKIYMKLHIRNITNTDLIQYK